MHLTPLNFKVLLAIKYLVLYFLGLPSEGDVPDPLEGSTSPSTPLNSFILGLPSEGDAPDPHEGQLPLQRLHQGCPKPARHRKGKLSSE